MRPVSTGRRGNRTNRGALDVRRLFMTKDGYRGTRIYYPSGTSTVQQPDGSVKQIPNHEIAMQIVETIADNVLKSEVVPANGYLA